MGCIYNRGTKAKPNFWIKWVGPSGAEYRKIGPDRALAKAALAKIEGDLVAQRFDVPREPPPPVPFFNAAADLWIESRSAIGADGLPAFRSWRDDRTRLKLHLRPRFGSLRLSEITIDLVRKLVDDMRRTHKPQSIRNALNCLSRVFEDQPQALKLTNPVRALGRSDRKRIGAGWDPKLTPFLKTKADVKRLYLAFPDLTPRLPWRAMFAAGALAGLRPGEVRALEWADIDFDADRIHVRRGETGPLKDDESRFVPLVPSLASTLQEWRTHCKPGAALVFPPIGHSGKQISEEAINAALRRALASGKFPASLTTYQTGRHTFGAQWVINGGSLHKLAAILGHCSTEVTQRYAHLVPGEFTEAERALVDLDLAPGRVLPLKRRRHGA